MTEKALRLGPLAVVFGLWAVIGALAADAALLLALPLLPREHVVVGVPVAFGVVGAISLFVAVLTLVRIARVDIGVRGRARLWIGAVAMIVAALAKIGFGVVLGLVLADPGYGALGAPYGAQAFSDVLSSTQSSLETIAVAQGTYAPLMAALTIGSIATHVQLGAGISTWFLVPERVRAFIWIVVDVPLLLAFVFALWALPFTPGEDGDPTLPGIALAISTLFALRFCARMLPPALDVAERIGFQTLVAARMLRAKKSGFLTAIGILSILAVSFSSCTLTTTLSVMGGFREDLQRKILGNNAHVVIDREYGTWEGWGPVLEHVREVRGVTGASPYVAGEVMVTSASNLGGAVLRGIDPRTIGDVTDLPRNMAPGRGHGRLEYLVHPERLLDLSAAEMTGSVLHGRDDDLLDDEDDEALDEPDRDAGTAVIGEDDETASAQHESLMREIDRVLGELDERTGDPPADPDFRTGSGAAVRVQDAFGRVDDPTGLFLGMPPPLQRPREVLPGLIVGQELARSLRLHVGDEVNVVSPLGDLGPAGPIPKSRPFRVAGIFYSGMYEYDMKVAYTDLETAQRFLSTGGAISGIEVRVDDWERADVVAAAIAQATSRPELRVRSWQEVNRNLFGALELEKLAMFITLGIAILVASFCIVGTLVLMVREKGRQVGILKAMGAQDGQIVGMFMLQGLFIGLVGAISGLGLGWVVCFAAEHLGIVPLNPEVYYIDSLPIHTDPREFFAVGVAAVVVCLLATIYPAILGSRLKPVDALRYS
ncbi:ABC transporter permease [Sandaracinus amylolyticus]|uniref:Lipoprotein releasing system transmembrane protein LolC n=1 Tax=Sandaracinus amylolyticus TaxID=927083 RepID=A0A0F6W5U5_9BACT|nr:ABC transporter permease [Sandaracinus amylolyticus]AKF08256.1 Lipoprotein releasing system transmembrane protein LolC [Sandaracinus amylolyticus]